MGKIDHPSMFRAWFYRLYIMLKMQPRFKY